MARKSRVQNTSVRTKLGITQEDYVSYLMCHRGMLAMYETDRRGLSGGAFWRHNAVELCLLREETAAVTAETEQEQEVAAIETLKKRRAICQTTVTKLQTQLTRMKEKYQQSLNLVRMGIAAPAILLEIYPQNDRYETDKRNLENMGSSGKDDLKHCGIGQQQLLQLRIEALQFEADRISEMVEGG